MNNEEFTKDFYENSLKNIFIYFYDNKGNMTKENENALNEACNSCVINKLNQCLKLNPDKLSKSCTGFKKFMDSL